MADCRIKEKRAKGKREERGGPGGGRRVVCRLADCAVVQDGVVYLQDQDANVYTLARQGQLKWEYQVNVPETSGPRPDGVALADGTVHGDPSSSLFAHGGASGKTTWVDIYLLNKGQGPFEILPAASRGKVVVELDDERKAAMVSNLLVLLCSDQATEPVVNTGTLYQ